MEPTEEAESLILSDKFRPTSDIIGEMVEDSRPEQGDAFPAQIRTMMSWTAESLIEATTQVQEIAGIRSPPHISNISRC